VTLLLTLIPLLIVGYLFGRMRRKGWLSVGNHPAGYVVVFVVVAVLVVVALFTGQWLAFALLLGIGSLIGYLTYLRSKAAESGSGG